MVGGHFYYYFRHTLFYCISQILHLVGVGCLLISFFFFFFNICLLLVLFFWRTLTNATTFTYFTTTYLRLFSFLPVMIHREIFQMKWVCGWFGLGTGAHSLIHLFDRSVLIERLLIEFPMLCTSRAMGCNSQRIQSTHGAPGVVQLGSLMPCAGFWGHSSEQNRFLPSQAHLDLWKIAGNQTSSPAPDASGLNIRKITSFDHEQKACNFRSLWVNIFWPSLFPQSELDAPSLCSHLSLCSPDHSTYLPVWICRQRDQLPEPRKKSYRCTTGLPGKSCGFW